MVVLHFFLEKLEQSNIKYNQVILYLYKFREAIGHISEYLAVFLELFSCFDFRVFSYLVNIFSPFDQIFIRF